MSTWAAQPRSPQPAGPVLPPSPQPAGPIIPPIPSRAKRGRRKPPTDLRGLAWTGAFVIGLAVGIVGYQWVPGVDTTFDYWLALALG
jgi:hypothetical protein